MIVKGIVSAIDLQSNTVSVILPEYGNIVTRPSKTYPVDGITGLKVNDFVLVVVFNDDFADCLILTTRLVCPYQLPDGDIVEY